MQNTTLEITHMIQKLINSGCREDALLRAKLIARRIGKPMCPPMIWNAKKRLNSGGRERSSSFFTGPAARMPASPEVGRELLTISCSVGVREEYTDSELWVSCGNSWVQG